MRDKNEIFHNLYKIADAVVALFGKNCETCVHDLTSLQSSLIYICGDVTHRKVGAPATDLLLKIINQKEGDDNDIHSYQTITSDGRSLKSTTTLYRDEEGRPVAAFCINFDTTEFYNASQALLPFSSIQHQDNTINKETFANSVAETIEALFKQGVEEIGKHPATMHIGEKTQLVAILDKHGTFQLKGAVEHIAPLLGVSKYTVYNYLKKVRTASSTTRQKEKIA